MPTSSLRSQLAARNTQLSLCPLILLCGICLWKAVHAPFSDYAGYYYGSRELLSGNWRNAYDLGPLNSIIARQGYRDIFVSYTPFPPFTSLVFALFTLAPLGPSKLVFNAFSCAFFILTIVRTRKFLSLPPYHLVLVPLIFLIPIVNNIFFGQSYLLLFSLLLEGYMAYRKRKLFLSSLFWGIAILFKLVPGLIFVFLLLRKRYRDIAWLAGSCLIFFGFSLWLNGAAPWHYYLGKVLPKMNMGELNDPFTYIFQSAFMLFKKALVYDPLLNSHPLWQMPYLFGLIMACFKSLIIGSAILLTWRAGKTQASKRDDLDFLSFGVWMMASMLVSPNGSSYSLILLLITWLGFAGPARPSKDWVLPVTGLILFAACSIPVQRFGSMPLFGQFPRLYLLLLFFAFTVLAGRGASPGIQAYRSPGYLPAAIFICLFAFFRATGVSAGIRRAEGSKYLLPKEEHLFIADFAVRDNHLVYTYMDPSGTHEVVTGYPAHSATDSGLFMRNDQIWYKGIELTHTPDRKEKARLVDGRTIVYLSDLHRGVGFYTLRVISLTGD